MELAVRAPARIAGRDAARSRAGGLMTLAMALIAVAINGYHPCAEDGGIYLAGVKKVLDPSLYVRGSQFVMVHLRFSLFAPLIAGLVRATHLGLMTALLLIYVGSIWATLYAVWLIAGHVTAAGEGRWGAVLFVALALTVPVAGTSLILMDPYVTARNFSTPAGLFALWCALEITTVVNDKREMPADKLTLGLGCLLLAAIMHPLMGAYAFGCVLLFCLSSLPSAYGRMLAMLTACITAVATAVCLWIMIPTPGTAYAVVANTRSYWFLADWHWYEIVGLIAPLLLLAWLWSGRPKRKPAREGLASMALAAGLTAAVVALLFAHTSADSYAVARLQPLRVFQTIYVLMLMALGAQAGESLLKRVVWRWAVACVLIGSTIVYVQMDTFPASRHIELPWQQARNSWVRGFEWIRTNTPKDAVFAMNANYIHMTGEDSQNFRAIAERGALADAAKDGGIASIAPDLSDRWTKESRAQSNLDGSFGAARIAQLRSLGATWVVLLPTTKTTLACPYTNEEMKICRLSP